MSKINYIYYGDGDIRIQTTMSIKAFDIKIAGTYSLESYNPENFLINYNNGRVIGVGLGSVLGEGAFLKYTGDLRILSCKVVTSENEMLNLIPKLVRNDKFDVVRNDFSGENIKFEDLDKVGVVGDTPTKTKINIITKNFNTKGGEYTLDGKDYVGDYHIHYTGVAMTGSDHTEDSEVLELRNKKQRIKTISGVVASISASSTSTGGY